jgi:hypothetical protein
VEPEGGCYGDQLGGGDVDYSPLADIVDAYFESPE